VKAPISVLAEDPFSKELLDRYDKLYRGSAMFTAGGACSGMFRRESGSAPGAVLPSVSAEKVEVVHRFIALLRFFPLCAHSGALSPGRAARLERCEDEAEFVSPPRLRQKKTLKDAGFLLSVIAGCATDPLVTER
jgi:hypothetical protein